MRIASEQSLALCLLAVFFREVRAQTAAQIDSAFSTGRNTVNNYKTQDDNAARAGYVLSGPGSSVQHQYSTKGSAPVSYNDPAFLFCAATLDLVDKKYVSKDATSGLSKLTFGPNTQAAAIQKQCYETTGGGLIDPRTGKSRCGTVRRYTFDGSCNNNLNPTWGRTNTCHKRLLAPAYEDGVDVPRSKSYAGGELPNERVISLRALYNILPKVEDDPNYNHNRMSFGQFIAHDVSLTPTTTIGANNALPDCCNPSMRIGQCFTINIPSPDPVYGNRRCMNFVRSQPCPTCQLGPREQMDAVTSFVDLSHIYGLTTQENNNLRTGSGGLLRGQSPYDENRRYLPLLMPPVTQTNGDGCSQPGRACFLGGDPLRVNQQIGISAWSTLWFRYHNYLADRVNQYAQSRGEKWSDERIFHTARRIAQAHMQLQVYREWLPTVVGSNIHSIYKLAITESQTDYNKELDPSLWSEFAGGAFRFGHSMIQNVFQNRDYVDPLYDRPNLDIATRNAFSTIPNYYSTNSDFLVENFIAGMYRQKAKKISFSFAPGVVHDVYRNATEQFGMDLPALNIHRGRDHGLQPYFKYAQIYLTKAYGKDIKINYFRDIQPYWRSECYEELRRVYNDVIQDVDLYVGGLCENSPISGSVGPTMGTIIAMQFNQLRYGDRLFVSHWDSFTPAQYRELSRTGWLNWVVCASGYKQPAAYRNAFRHDDTSYDMCADLERKQIDMSLFTDIAKDL